MMHFRYTHLAFEKAGGVSYYTCKLLTKSGESSLFVETSYNTIDISSDCYGLQILLVVWLIKEIFPLFLNSYYQDCLTFSSRTLERWWISFLWWLTHFIQSTTSGSLSLYRKDIKINCIGPWRAPVTMNERGRSRITIALEAKEKNLRNMSWLSTKSKKVSDEKYEGKSMFCVVS